MKYCVVCFTKSLPQRPKHKGVRLCAIMRCLTPPLTVGPLMGFRGWVRFNPCDSPFAKASEDRCASGCCWFNGIYFFGWRGTGLKCYKFRKCFIGQIVLVIWRHRIAGRFFRRRRCLSLLLACRILRTMLHSARWCGIPAVSLRGVLLHRHHPCL